MRSTNEIVIAVKECQPVTEEELKLALVSSSNVELSYWRMLTELIEAIREDKPLHLLKMKAEMDWQSIEGYFAGQKKPVDEWLGPGNIPGTPESNQRRQWAKGVYKAATGEDL